MRGGEWGAGGKKKASIHAGGATHGRARNLLPGPVSPVSEEESPVSLNRNREGPRYECAEAGRGRGTRRVECVLLEATCGPRSPCVVRRASGCPTVVVSSGGRRTSPFCSLVSMAPKSME